MLILGIIFAGISLLASRLLAPRNPTAAKQDPYECGNNILTRTTRTFPSQVLSRRHDLHSLRC